MNRLTKYFVCVIACILCATVLVGCAKTGQTENGTSDKADIEPQSTETQEGSVTQSIANDPVATDLPTTGETQETTLSNADSTADVVSNGTDETTAQNGNPDEKAETTHDDTSIDNDVSNSLQGQQIEAATSEDPELGFWIALQCETNIMTVGTPFDINISFGTAERNPDCFDVIIESEDFEIVKSCPDRYVVDGEEYSASDFYTNTPKELSFEKLPQKFKMTLTKSEEKDLYCGEITVTIMEYMIGGYGTAKITLYYYGNNEIVSFSTISHEDAENTFHSPI